LIQGLYEGPNTSVESMCRVTENFNVGVGVHQGSVLSCYLFFLIMDEVTKGIQGEIPWCIMFADDIVLV